MRQNTQRTFTHNVMNCKLIGNHIQYLEIELLPAESFYAERKSLIYHEEGIEAQSEFQGSGIGGILGAHFSGESVITIAYVNRSAQPKKLVLGSGNALIPVKLDGMELICRRGAYVASSKKLSISAKLSISGFVGGMGFVLQRIRGEGTTFLDCVGQPIVLKLNPNQVIQLDENHVVGLHGIPEDRIQARWALKNLFRGEGLSLLEVRGPGTVYISPGRFSLSTKAE